MPMAERLDLKRINHYWSILYHRRIWWTIGLYYDITAMSGPARLAPPHLYLVVNSPK